MKNSAGYTGVIFSDRLWEYFQITGDQILQYFFYRRLNFALCLMSTLLNSTIQLPYWSSLIASRIIAWLIDLSIDRLIDSLTDLLIETMSVNGSLSLGGAQVSLMSPFVSNTFTKYDLFKKVAVMGTPTIMPMTTRYLWKNCRWKE